MTKKYLIRYFVTHNVVTEESGRRGEDVSLGFDQGSCRLCFSNIGIGQYCDIGSQFIPPLAIGCFFLKFHIQLPSQMFFSCQMIGVGLAPDEDVSMAALVAADVKA